jgi:hypothetical protein
MVLGENGTIFASGWNEDASSQLVAFNVGSGTILWKRSGAEIVAALHDGGVLVEGCLSPCNTPGPLMRIDASGGATSISAGASTSGSRYWGVGRWLTSSHNSLALVQGTLTNSANTGYPFVEGNLQGQSSAPKPIFKFFLPVEISDPPALARFEQDIIDDHGTTSNNQFFDAFNQPDPPLRWRRGKPTVDKFLESLPSPFASIQPPKMDVLVFIGHSIYAITPKGCVAVGICLLDKCLEKYPMPPDDLN